MTDQTPPPAYQQPAYAAPKPTNGLAIAALITGILVPVVGIILGHISLSQIKKTGENGRGMALAGTVIGYVLTGIYIISWIIVGITAAALYATIPGY